MTTPRVYTVAEVAAQLRVSPMTVYRMVHDGTLRSLKVCGQYRVPAAAVHEYLAGARGRG